MQFLNRLVIPESTEHLALLKYLLVLVTIMFVTYSSIALIASTVSALLNSLGRRERGREGGDKARAEHYLRFARDLASLAAPSKGVITALAILPLVSSVLIYAQLLTGLRLGITTDMTLASILCVAGLFSVYYCKRSFEYGSIFSGFKRLSGGASNVEGAIDVETLGRKALATQRTSGRRGAILLWLGIWLYLGTTRLTFVTSHWDAPSFLSVLFSASTFLSLLNFAVSAIFITSAAVLFFFFTFENGIAIAASEDYKSYVKRFALPAGIVTVALEPLMIFLEIRNLPQTGLSNATFAIAGLGMFVALLVLIMFYNMSKYSAVNLGGYTFVGVILLVFVWAAKDEIAFNYATRVQDQNLGVRYEAMLESLGEGKPQPVMSGEDIYNSRCSACHRFDRKLVGPPYFMTLPHFVGKMDSLEDFISNPYQAVAGYPPMPNQGLKPQEVKNVAEYIMGVYLSAKKAGTAKFTE